MRSGGKLGKNMMSGLRAFEEHKAQCDCQGGGRPCTCPPASPVQGPGVPRGARLPGPKTSQDGCLHPANGTSLGRSALPPGSGRSRHEAELPGQRKLPDHAWLVGSPPGSISLADLQAFWKALAVKHGATSPHPVVAWSGCLHLSLNLRGQAGRGAGSFLMHSSFPGPPL